jgi:hypothetical protein
MTSENISFGWGGGQCGQGNTSIAVSMLRRCRTCWEGKHTGPSRPPLSTLSNPRPPGRSFICPSSTARVCMYREESSSGLFAWHTTSHVKDPPCETVHDVQHVPRRLPPFPCTNTWKHYFIPQKQQHPMRYSRKPPERRDRSPQLTPILPILGSSSRV